MSYYRESPSKRSPYDRSPAKVLQSERDYIEEQIRLKSAYRSQAENRRLLDEISLLQIRTRKIDQLEAKCDALQKQNSLLILDNDSISKELSERRYDLERIKSNTVQVQERDAVRCHQLEEINRSLEIEAELLKKERLQSNKLYESHIQKLEIMLEDRIKENEILSQRANDLINEKEIAEIRFEEEKNKMKNLMSRTSYDLERELEYNRDKQTTEKFVELDTLKKNHVSQIAVLDDQIAKLKAANNYKNTEFEGQLQENKNLKQRYEEQMKALIIENDAIRQRILKLEQMNKTQVENIQQKYSEIHNKGTHSLKEQHQRQIILLLEEIDREKWIIAEKNSQIQTLIREKREQQTAFRDRQLALTSEIDSLKNKLEIEQNQATSTIQELTRKNNNLGNKNLRDSENYFERVKGFLSKIKELEAEIETKQSELENEKSNRVGIQNELTCMIEELTDKLIRRQATIADNEYQITQLQNTGSSSQEQSQAAIQNLKNEISSLEVALENEQTTKSNAQQEYQKQLELLKIANSALKQTVNKLQQKLSEEQQSHSQQLQELSEKTSDKLAKLQALNKKLFEELNSTHKNELETLNIRIEKLERDKGDMETKLQEYVKLYEGIETYFEKPHDGAVFKEKGSSSIYEVLTKTSKSTIHIF